MRGRWDQIQTGFVDEPRQAVQQADELVATAMKHIAETFSNERTRLEQQWDRGDDVNTEDLRQALRKYRRLFPEVTLGLVLVGQIAGSSAPTFYASNSPVMTVTACPPSSTRSPLSLTRTTPPRADA